MKEFSLISILNLPWHNSRLCHLILSLVTWEQSSTPTGLHSPVRELKGQESWIRNTARAAALPTDTSTHRSSPEEFSMHFLLQNSDIPTIQTGCPKISPQFKLLFPGSKLCLQSMYQAGSPTHGLASPSPQLSHREPSGGTNPSRALVMQPLDGEKPLHYQKGT